MKGLVWRLSLDICTSSAFVQQFSMWGNHLYCVGSHKLQWHCKMFCSPLKMWQCYLRRQFACTGQIKRQISRTGFKGNSQMLRTPCPGPAYFEWWRTGERAISNAVDDLHEIVKWETECWEAGVKMSRIAWKCHIYLKNANADIAPAVTSAAGSPHQHLHRHNMLQWHCGSLFEQNKKLPGHGDLTWRPQ